MSAINMHLFSKALNMYTTVNVVLPEAGADMPVLYLLHGIADDADAWLNKTAVARYAEQAGIAVVMPDGGLSCYHNMLHGERYMEYIAEELPAMMRRCFPISHRREKSFIAGCSMGGYGALKIGFGYAQNYAAVGCFSSAHAELRSKSRRIQHAMECAYGDGIDACDAKVQASLAAAMTAKAPSRLYHAWGDADFIRANAEKMRDWIQGEAHPALEYRSEMLEGRHDWALWDKIAERFLQWLAEGMQ